MSNSLKDRYEITSASWDKVAKLYEEKFMGIDLYNETYDEFLNGVSLQARVLDVGCGPGNISSYLLGKHPTLKVKGIDVSPSMIDLAKVNNPSASFEVMDIRDLDKEKKVYDGIMCGFCVPYLSKSDLQKLISDCHFLLSSDGVLYISFVEGTDDQSGYITGSTGDRMYFNYHSLDWMKTELVKKSFVLLRSFKVSYPRSEDECELHTVLILRKNM